MNGHGYKQKKQVAHQRDRCEGDLRQCVKLYRYICKMPYDIVRYFFTNGNNNGITENKQYPEQPGAMGGMPVNEKDEKKKNKKSKKEKAPKQPKAPKASKEPKTPKQPKEKKGKGGKVALIIILIVVVLALGGGAFSLCFSSFVSTTESGAAALSPNGPLSSILVDFLTTSSTSA